MAKKLTDEDRRRMILRALDPGVNVTKLAEEYGVHRNLIHWHVNQVTNNPERRMREAEAEASFRRQIYEATR